MTQRDNPIFFLFLNPFFSFFPHAGLAVHEQRLGDLSQGHPDNPQADGGRPLPHSRTMGPPGLSLRPSLGKRDLL